MRAISAAECVSLAIQRTREFLFRPFSWGTYLKLGLVAIITEGLGWNLQSSSHNGQSGGNGLNLPPVFNLWQLLIPAMFALALAAIVLFWVFYLITRLRFAFFHCLIHNTKQIRPGWRFYREPAARFFWLNVGVGFCFLLVVALISLPFISGFLRLFQETRLGSPFDFGLLLSLVLPLIPIILLLALAGFLADLILRDLMLPHYALENTTAGEAWSQALARIMAEKRQFIVYALLRVALPAIAMAALFIVLFLPGLVLAGSLAAVEWGLNSTFSDATGASALVGKLLEVFFGLLALGFAVLASICLGGFVSTGIREYALIFYGGRYKALGDILDPPPPTQPALGASEVA
jgi:hypothetical protein